MLGEIPDVGVTLEEPEQFVDDRLEVQLLGRHQRKPVGERIARLRAEHGIRAGAGAIGLEPAFLEHEAEQLMVLVHGEL